MSVSILNDGGSQTITNAANGVTGYLYYTLQYGRDSSPPVAASFNIFSLTNTTIALHFSNSVLPLGLDAYNATATQLDNLNWVNRTMTVTGYTTIVNDLDLNMDSPQSYRFVRIAYTPSNVTNGFSVEFNRG